MGADPDAQCFLAHAELAGDAGDRTPGRVRVGLGVEHEFYGALLELWGVLDGHVRGSFSSFLPSIKPGANQCIDESGNTIIEFSDGTVVTVNKGECAACGGSSGIGSSDGTEGSSLTRGPSSSSSDARCVQAAATVGLPLLALIPIGIATQVNIPGLSPLVADAQAQLQRINTDLQQQSGIYDEETARLIAQINAELENDGGAIGQAVGAAAVIAIGGLVGKYLYDNCVPRS